MDPLLVNDTCVFHQHIHQNHHKMCLLLVQLYLLHCHMGLCNLVKGSTTDVTTEYCSFICSELSTPACWTWITNITAISITNTFSETSHQGYTIYHIPWTGDYISAHGAIKCAIIHGYPCLCLPVLHSSIFVHWPVKSSFSYPLLQSHSKLPRVFLHFPPEQGSVNVKHSSSSSHPLPLLV